jgi:hypothetical protein
MFRARCLGECGLLAALSWVVVIGAAGRGVRLAGVRAGCWRQWVNADRCARRAGAGDRGRPAAGSLTCSRQSATERVVRGGAGRCGGWGGYERVDRKGREQGNVRLGLSRAAQTSSLTGVPPVEGVPAATNGSGCRLRHAGLDGSPLLIWTSLWLGGRRWAGWGVKMGGFADARAGGRSTVTLCGRQRQSTGDGHDHGGVGSSIATTDRAGRRGRRRVGFGWGAGRAGDGGFGLDCVREQRDRRYGGADQYGDGYDDRACDPCRCFSEQRGGRS